MTARRFFWLTMAVDAAAVILAVLAAAGLGGTGAVTGAGIGGALGTGNLAVLLVLGRKVLVARGPRWPYVVGIAAKFVVLIALVYLAVLHVPMDAAWFVAGLSGSGAALVAASLVLAAGPVDLEP